MAGSSFGSHVERQAGLAVPSSNSPYFRSHWDKNSSDSSQTFAAALAVKMRSAVSAHLAQQRIVFFAHFRWKMTFAAQPEVVPPPIRFPRR